jgi:hypothetical protein
LGTILEIALQAPHNLNFEIQVINEDKKLKGRQHSFELEIK